jgi:outer membrane protein assembly factor BamE (lipoprotein component of BamABCDE complex)
VSVFASKILVSAFPVPEILGPESRVSETQASETWARVGFSARRLVAGLVILSAASVLSACSGIGETNVHGIVLTEKMLAQVKPGQTQQQVVEALGTPSTTSTMNGEAFYYVSQTTSRAVAFLQPTIVDRTVVVVYFDKGKVTRVANYGLKDGVVFDMVSRTTPTAGSELNFLTQLIRGLGKGIPGLSP